MEFNQLHFFLDSSLLIEWNDNEMKSKRAAEKKKWRADEWNGGYGRGPALLQRTHP